MIYQNPAQFLIFDFVQDFLNSLCTIIMVCDNISISNK